MMAQMYDVGMASMVAMSDASLAELADAIGRQGTVSLTLTLTLTLSLSLSLSLTLTLTRASHPLAHRAP